MDLFCIYSSIIWIMLLLIHHMNDKCPIKLFSVIMSNPSFGLNFRCVHFLFCFRKTRNQVRYKQVGNKYVQKKHLDKTENYRLLEFMWFYLYFEKQNHLILWAIMPYSNDVPYDSIAVKKFLTSLHFFLWDLLVNDVWQRKPW